MLIQISCIWLSDLALAMNSLDRRTRERIEVQDKILSAARDLFVRQGFDAVSMRKIAEAIDYTPAALYVHFKDKVELMRELCRRDFAEMDARVLALQIADPVERIHRAGEIFIAFGTQHKNQYRLMFMTPHPREVQPTAEDLAEMVDPDQNGYAFMCKAVAEAIAKGRLRDEYGEIQLTVQTLWSCVHGVTALHITHSDDPWVRMRPLRLLGASALDSFLRGMLRPGDAYHAVLDARGAEVAKEVAEMVRAGSNAELFAPTCVSGPVSAAEKVTAVQSVAEPGRVKGAML